MEKKMYMNVATGSVGDYDSWYYENSHFELKNAVAEGEVVEVIWDETEQAWKEA